MKKNLKATLLTLATLGAIAAPVAGYAFAQGTQTQNQTGQANDAETNDGPDIQTPGVKGSITLPAEAAGTETADNGQDAAQYQSLAKITPAQASAAAQARVPGAVSSVMLGDENGSLIYEVIIGNTAVKVDAGNGQVLGQDMAGAETGNAQGETGAEQADSGTETGTETSD